MVKVTAAPQGDGWTCEVEVEASGRRTAHTVTVSRADVERWSRGPEVADVKDLVARSFEFLLEREPPGSILRSFELSVIERYFPEYGDRFRRRSTG